MHCVRRAALRAACSSSRAVAAPRQQVAAIAMQVSKASVQSTGVLSSLPRRYFSQTSPVAEEDRDWAVENAINEAQQNGSSFDNGGTLESSPTESQRARTEGHTIFISNVTFDATETHLEEAFGKYGQILQTRIGRDGRGLSRGFAFINFVNKESADRAIAESNDTFWHGRRITVDYRKDGPTGKKPRASNGTPTNSLYIGNIPYETSDADLNKLFRSLHNCKDVRVAIDRNTGWPRGFAHADFVDIESAVKAYEALNQYELGGRTLRVDYAESRRVPGSDGSGFSGRNAGGDNNGFSA
ncbi:RNA-binding domain-containing protein [Xylaria venustula]|nr:RNA-binding domain-containing protein [Xylaria venustula]